MSLACASRALGSCAAARRASPALSRLAPARQHARWPPAPPPPGTDLSSSAGARLAESAQPPRRLQALPGLGDQLDSETRSELPGWLSLAAFAAQELAKRQSLGLQLTAPLLFKALAWYTLASALLAALDVPEVALQDRVGGFVGPVFLAVNFLGGLGGLLSPFEAAVAGFGVLMTDSLPAFDYSRWVWLASLGAAIHTGLSAQWLVAAFGVASIWRLVRGAQGGGGVRLQNAAFAALAAWAFYGRQEAPIALAIMAGHMMAEVVS